MASANGNDVKINAKKQEKADQHVEAVIREKQQLVVEDFPIAHRLLDEELATTQTTGRAAFDDRYIDVYNEKPIRVQARVLFPSKDVPTFNFVGKLLGPKGSTLKSLQEQTKCKMVIMGKGSMRDKNKEEELRGSTDPKYAHLSDQLHCEVACVAPPAEAYSRIAFALSQLQLVLVPDPPGEGFYPSFEDEGYRGGPPHRIPPLVETKVKVMGFLEKARHSMEYQPSTPRGRGRGGYGSPPVSRYEEPYHRRGEDEYGRPGGFGRSEGYGHEGGFGRSPAASYYSPRPAPYSRY